MGFKKLSAVNGYQHLLIKTGAFIILAFIADFFVGGIFHYFYFKQSSGWEYRTKYSIEDTRADVLIFGASRAQQQYNPDYIEKKTGLTCYNTGRDGEPVFYYYGVLQGVLKRYTPKIIILDVENNVFRESQDSYDRLSILLPYYTTHPEMRPVIELRSPFEKLKLQSRVYPFNSMLFKIAIGNTDFNKKRFEDIKGYVPLTGALDEPIRTVDLSKNKYAVDTNKINCYKSFINDCLKANIKLYLVCSPYFFRAVGEDTSMQIAKEIAKERKVDFIDFSKDKLFLSNSKFFDDTIHVNVSGSEIFSNKVADTLLSKINSNAR
ncbi:MAG: esterase, hydrolase-type domain [Ferruginibacter sp.]|uniref:hypothetical protein n=1 Tax=Ferruginibacter sp. TaxID=1940288 RepID=UPI0026596CF2|nr:hypothetical protein [Ferruginibacter sp.]MDB5277769.1 esterase, hydrolase-type domain [Ferruginibacter sp.]